MRKMFPNANNIPSTLTKKEKKDLRARLTADASGASMVLDKDLVAPGLNIEKAKRRAGVLKHSYPELAGLIPNAISAAARKAFIEKHSKSGETQEVIHKRVANPPREVRTTAENLRREQGQHPGAQITPVAFENTRYPTRALLQKALQSEQQTFETRDASAKLSDRMAPLSDARRAEVARNLSGTSAEDPIDIN